MAEQTTPTELAALRARVAALETALGAEHRRRRGRGRWRHWLGVALVAVLALLPARLGASDRFDDVPDGAFFHDDATALAEAGITLGCGGNNYCPDQVVNRGQMASFLARAAGLGDNPPVANALTAQTVPDGSITVAKLSAEGSSAGQVLTSTGGGVAWQAAPGGTYARTVIVSPVGTATQNGTALRDALAGITTASAASPFLLKIEPGIYDLGTTSLQMKQFVDIEGSGEGVTTITGSLDNAFSGVVRTADNTELRLLTVENTGTSGFHVAVFIGDNMAPRLTQMTAQASGAGTSALFGMRSQGTNSRPFISRVTATGNVTTSGAANGYSNLGGTATIEHSTFSANGNSVSGTEVAGISGIGGTITIRASLLRALGGQSSNRGLNLDGGTVSVDASVISATGGALNNAYFVTGASAATFTVVASRLEGGIGMAGSAGRTVTLENSLVSGGISLAASAGTSSLTISSTRVTGQVSANGAATVTAEIRSSQLTAGITLTGASRTYSFNIGGSHISGGITNSTTTSAVTLQCIVSYKSYAVALTAGCS